MREGETPPGVRRQWWLLVSAPSALALPALIVLGMSLVAVQSWWEGSTWLAVLFAVVAVGYGVLAAATAVALWRHPDWVDPDERRLSRTAARVFAVVTVVGLVCGVVGLIVLAAASDRPPSGLVAAGVGVVLLVGAVVARRVMTRPR